MHAERSALQQLGLTGWQLPITVKGEDKGITEAPAPSPMQHESRLGWQCGTAPGQISEPNIICS